MWGKLGMATALVLIKTWPSCIQQKSNELAFSSTQWNIKKGRGLHEFKFFKVCLFLQAQKTGQSLYHQLLEHPLTSVILSKFFNPWDFFLPIWIDTEKTQDRLLYQRMNTVWVSSLFQVFAMKESSNCANVMWQSGYIIKYADRTLPIQFHRKIYLHWFSMGCHHAP